MFRNRSSVEPLLGSKWGQHRSNDGLDNTAYNDFAPDSGCTYGSSHCPAGCVAVAMGQIMNYWKYPFFITQDNDVFDWCNMSNELRTDNSNYVYNKKAVNLLLKACGKSVDMSYHCQGSESSILSAVDAFREIFHYKSNVTSFYFNDFGFSIGALEDKIIDELDEGRPVLMRAADPRYGGHAFVCDGYKRRGEAHINWGWAGEFDGYFQIDNLRPGDYYFLVGLGIVYKIMPDVEYQNQSIVNLDVFYSDYLTNNYAPYRLVPEQSDKLYSASINSPAAWRTIPENAISIYEAHEEIILQPGFTAEYGSNFTARINPCGQGMMLLDEIVDNETIGTDSSTYGLRSYKSGDTTILMQHSNLYLYPNPADNTVTVENAGKIEDIRIVDNMGRPVFRWYVVSNTGEELTLNVGNIPNGTYILHLTTSDKKHHFGHFVKK